MDIDVPIIGSILVQPIITIDDILAEEIKNTDKYIVKRGGVANTITKYALTETDITSKSLTQLLNIRKGTERGIIQPYNFYKEDGLKDDEPIRKLTKVFYLKYNDFGPGLEKLFDMNLNTTKEIQKFGYYKNTSSDLFFSQIISFAEIIASLQETENKQKLLDCHKKIYSTYRSIAKSIKNDENASTRFYDCTGRIAHMIAEEIENPEEKITWLKRAYDGRIKRAKHLEMLHDFKEAGVLYSYCAKILMNVAEIEPAQTGKLELYKKNAETRKKAVENLEKTDDIEELAISQGYLAKTYSIISKNMNGDDSRQEERLKLEHLIIGIRENSAMNYESLISKNQDATRQAAINWIYAIDTSHNCFYLSMRIKNYEKMVFFMAKTESLIDYVLTNFEDYLDHKTYTRIINLDNVFQVPKRLISDCLNQSYDMLQKELSMDYKKLQKTNII